MNQKKILLVEDDETLSSAIQAFLSQLGFDVTHHSNVESIMGATQEYDLVLSDVRMKGLSGYDLLKFIRKTNPAIPIILMTGHGSIEKAVEAMKNGAYDFLVKPFSLSVLEMAIRAAFLDRAAYQVKGISSEPSGPTRIGLRRVSEHFVSQEPKMLEIIDNLKRVAPSKATVLIQGESGTGKELIAHMIHEFSPRAERIFVAINCAAMPDSLLESELFGHEKGSFTGAFNRQIGKFELSNNGTILLDEISEMSLGMQTKLLRVLQECEIYRVGGVKPIPLNIRVIATTNRDLFKYMKEGGFREDLYYRINVIPVVVPPLRDRGRDILVLAKEFLEEFAVLHARPVPKIDEAATAQILGYGWRGNVRELRNAMERVVLVSSFSVIEEGLALGSNGIKNFIDMNMKLDDIERQVILNTLERFSGNRTRAANQLGISLRTLRNKLRSYGEDHSFSAD